MFDVFVFVLNSEIDPCMCVVHDCHYHLGEYPACMYFKIHCKDIITRRKIIRIEEHILDMEMQNAILAAQIGKKTVDLFLVSSNENLNCK